jgi:hypothetical protein
METFINVFNDIIGMFGTLFLSGGLYGFYYLRNKSGDGYLGLGALTVCSLGVGIILLFVFLLINVFI